MLNYFQIVLKLILVVVCLSSSTQVFAQSSSIDVINGKVNQLIDSKVKPDDPGIAVAILKDGKVISKTVRGRANLDYNIPVNNQTSFNIASNAKQFTAAAILLLEREKLISLDDDFRKYTPEILKDYPGKISLRNLLNHTSGIRDVYDLWALQGKTWWQIFIGNDDALNLLKGQTELNFKPGTKYLYSNSNYLILAQIVKTVTKTSLKDYVKKKIFEPLEMKNTEFADNYMQVIPNKADSYGNFSGWKKYPWITNVYGDGALFTTIDDQIKWEQHLYNPKLWDAKFNNELLQPLKTEDQSFYGFGLMFEDYKGLAHTYHDGSTGAYNASFDRFPTENLSIIVISNNGQISTRDLSFQLAEIVIDKVKFTAIDNELKETDTTAVNTQPDILGDYQFEDGLIIKIKNDGTSIFREIYGRDPIKLKRISNSIYSYEGNDNLKMKFDLQNGKATSLAIYYPTQKPQKAVKLLPLEIPNDYYPSINGKYFNDETKTFIEIKYKDGVEYNLNKNDRTRVAKLIRKDYLGMNSYQILIDRNPKGEIIGLIVNNNRIINVKFKKLN